MRGARAESLEATGRGVVHEVVNAFVAASLLRDLLPVVVLDHREEDLLLPRKLVRALPLERPRGAGCRHLVRFRAVGITHRIVRTGCRAVCIVVTDGARAVPRVLEVFAEDLLEVRGLVEWSRGLRPHFGGNVGLRRRARSTAAARECDARWILKVVFRAAEAHGDGGNDAVGDVGGRGRGRSTG